MGNADAYPIHRAALAQVGGLLALVPVIWALVRFARVDPAGVGLALAMLQGGVAAGIALGQGAPRWWLLIHLAFVPLLYLALQLDIAPGWFLAAFVLLLLVFWRTDRSRVPLFLSNRPTAVAVAAQLPATPCRVLDLGCGDGGLLLRLARKRPDCRFVGVEHAPLPWLLARLRTRRQPNIAIRFGDFWRIPLGDYDLVYAFLSPAPMPRLWHKACAEMRPDALLVSNSFAVPGAQALRTLRVRDRRATRLHIYRPDKAPDSTAFPPIPAHADRQ